MSNSGGKGAVVDVVVMVVVVANVVGAIVGDAVELVCYWRGYGGKCGRGRTRSRARALR